MTLERIHLPFKRLSLESLETREHCPLSGILPKPEAPFFSVFHIQHCTLFMYSLVNNCQHARTGLSGRLACNWILGDS
jgi:hypothetical protein